MNPDVGKLPIGSAPKAAGPDASESIVNGISCGGFGGGGGGGGLIIVSTIVFTFLAVHPYRIALKRKEEKHESTGDGEMKSK
jgi:hypothetical protein